MRAAAFLEDTIVPIENYGEFLEKLEAILAEYNLTYTYAGHIGDGSIRLVPLVNFEKEGIKDEIMELSEKVYNLVFEFGGSMSVDHNDGLIRTVFLEKMYGAEMVSLFRRVKELFDPLNIFNQGKKVDLIGLNPKDYILTRNRS
jgi:FAD/FMN-containing dehydrogenase